MSLAENIKAYANKFEADLSEKNGVWNFSKLIAERKAFLSKKKLEYIAKFRIDEESKTIKFTEILKESGSGLSGGSNDSGDGMSPGIGIKTESFNTFKGPREGSIEEQSNLFGKKYSYVFDYKEVRTTLEGLASAAGYEFKYRITSIGL